MRESEALDRVAAAPVGRLATISPAGRPHLVPVTFALVERAVVHMVDDKPKTTTELRRIANIEANPATALIVDEYSGDWDKLWWVRIDGESHVATSGSEWRDARAALIAKYAQYAERPPTGQAIFTSIDSITSWSSTP